MRRRNAAESFLIITDEGREHAMTRIARKLQQPHYLPSQLGGQPYRNEIKLLIEDPLAKRSDESYFIQIADTIAFITMLYSIKNLYRGTADWANRVKRVLSYDDATALMDLLLPVLNTQASGSNQYGIVNYPR